MAKEHQDATGLRVGVKAGGCSGFEYVFAWEPAPKGDDLVFEGPSGVRVWIDPRSHRLLDGTTLDYDTSLLSRGFVFQNPHAKSTCGCGTSFYGVETMSTSTETIEQLASREYKYGFETDRRDRHVPARPRRAGRPALVGDQGRAGVAARVPAEVVPRLARHEGADVAQPQDRADRLPGAQLLLGAEEEARARRAWTKSIPRCARPSRSSAFRSRSRSCSSGVAVDAVFDSVSVATTFRTKLAEIGIIFCSFSEAVKHHPELVQQVPRVGRAVHRQLLRDAELRRVQRRLVRLRAEGRALPDGALDLLPHQRAQHRPVRAHAHHRRRGRVRELPRGLHRADARREPAARGGRRARRARRRDDQVLDDPELVPRRQERQGRHLQLRHQARHGATRNAKITWTQVETGSAITWKYPSCILQGDNSVGEFYSVATTNNWQQADTGTKMIHIGKNTRSTIVSKGISAGHGQNTYRGAVKIGRRTRRARATTRSATRCSSATSAARTRSRTSKSRTPPPRSSTKRRRRRSARTRSSTAVSAASPTKTP